MAQAYCQSRDWLKGKNEYHGDETYNYFTCGQYSVIDGWHVVHFPKGMSVYHGSARFADVNVEYPIGVQFYELRFPHSSDDYPISLDQASQSSDSVVSLLSQKSGIQPSWYASPEIGPIYTRFNMKPSLGAVFEFVTKRDIVMLLINRDENIIRLMRLAQEQQDSKVMKAILSMFGYSSLTTFNEEADTGILTSKNRRSCNIIDGIFARWICQNVITRHGFSGYASPEVKTKFHGGKFHLEFIFCDATLYLDRVSKISVGNYPEVKLFLEQMKKYITIDTDFQAGNLYEHSCWITLFSEQLSLLIDAPIEEHRYIAIAAFLHDIGKMDSTWPSRVNPFRGEVDYDLAPDHPQIGARYLLGHLPLRILGRSTDQYIDIEALVGELLEISGSDIPIDLEDEYIPFWRTYFAFIAEVHWEIWQSLYEKLSQDRLEAIMEIIDEHDDNVMNNDGLLDVIQESFSDEIETILSYIFSLNGVMKEVGFFKFPVITTIEMYGFLIRSALIVSTADILAIHPYQPEGNLHSTPDRYVRQIKTSRYLDFISDVPQVYPGSEFGDQELKDKFILLEKFVEFIVNWEDGRIVLDNLRDEEMME